MSDELVCVDDTHYIHIGDNEKTGKPCNSSVSPTDWQHADGIRRGGWTCIGCNRWWKSMPELPEKGIAALAELRDEPETE